MIASICSSPGLEYPDAGELFSPEERYPEYAFDHVSARPNPVYALVRQTLAQCGLDREHHGTPQWNPFGRYIARGQSVFVLCNFVYHRRAHESHRAFHAKCIHGSVLRALIDYVLLATGPDVTVRFGNSASQACNWNDVLTDTGAASVVEFYEKHGARVEAQDLRLYVAERSALGRVKSIDRRDSPETAVEIDLGRDSLLSGLDRPGQPAPRFRISDYDPKRIEAFHSGRSNRYVIHRAVLDADVVVSLPKLKTHEKVGITCGLKGFVGTVGHKDCLAHHRYGNPKIGGDEYPDALAFLRPVSAFSDGLNSRPPRSPLQGLGQIVERNLRRVIKRLGLRMSGAWHGNDTAWRMTLDLARIVHYADRDGRIGPERQRRHMMLLDGIVAGEGDGPLVPTPAGAGALLFADDVPAGDRLACRLMGFDPDRIPLVREAAAVLGSSVADPAALQLVVNGRPVPESGIAPVLGRPFLPPSGWRAYLADTG